MRHRVYGKHLGRDKNQRAALFKGLVRSLFLHEAIITSEAKAKAIKGLVDKVITKGRRKTPSSKQFIDSIITDHKVSKKLLDDITIRYKNRTSGFTQITKLGRRLGDGAMMVKMNLIEDTQSPTESVDQEK